MFVCSTKMHRLFCCFTYYVDSLDCAKKFVDLFFVHIHKSQPEM